MLGGKGNEEFLLGYGFTLHDNPCDYVTLLLSLDASDEVSECYSYVCMGFHLKPCAPPVAWQEVVALVSSWSIIEPASLRLPPSSVAAAESSRVGADAF